MTHNPYTSHPSRLGFHYYPDTLHYCAAHANAWLPVLHGLGAGWLVLKSETARAIPEQFLCAVVQAGIKPVIDLDVSLETPPQAGQVRTLLDVYSRWGARYVSFFQQPNARAAWPGAGWAQQELVERFLDRFLPLAQSAVDAGMKPLFPALAPGGSYWDTAFLRTALEMMERRKSMAVLDALVLSAYARTGGRHLDWGAGGPQKWPMARPYHTPPGSEDHRGFHIYEWYLAAASPVLGSDAKIILLQAGLPAAPTELTAADTASERYAQDCVTIARSLTDGMPGASPLPPQVLAANFWLLSAEKGSPAASQAWFSEDGPPHLLAARLQALRRQKEEQCSAPAAPEPRRGIAKPIAHYLLLPGECASADWYLEVIRPYIKKHQPTLGFSPLEAERAARVTIVGNLQHYPTGILERLQSSGCKVDQIQGTGTEIASILAER